MRVAPLDFASHTWTVASGMTWKVVLVAIFLLVGYFAIALLVTRLTPPTTGALRIDTTGKLGFAGERLTIFTWNLGYGGLGAASDFAADGGIHYFPPSRSAVLDNLAGIRRILDRATADVFLLQEVPTSSFANFWVNIRNGISSRFASFASVFLPDIATRLLPFPLAMVHGNATYSAYAVQSAEARPLPLEPDWYAGVLRHYYQMLIIRLPIAETHREWVIVNVHLAAFDANAAIRHRQIARLLEFGNQEYLRGNSVIIGGDFNLEFVRDQFPNQSEAKDRFWIHDFPMDLLPSGWRAIFDPTIPSVRTLSLPYLAGRNYTTVVDGFLISPNVQADGVSGQDLGFANSDHQPVSATFSVR